MVSAKATIASCVIGAMATVIAARASSPLVLSCDAFPPNASSAELQLAFGSAESGSDSLPLGASEGDMVPSTVLFPRDPTRRIQIVWKDRTSKRSPRFVQVSRGPTEWKTPQGITIGTSLRELERLNGRPFHLAGFAFDGSGMVTSWDGGRLAPPRAALCAIRISVDSFGVLDSAGSRWYRQVVGDRVFSSGHPAMQALNPRVSDLLLQYP
jgi:hypothetical protein